MKLHQLIKPELIRLDLESNDRMDVIHSLVDLLLKANLIEDFDTVENMVCAREREVGTGIGYGVAIPHADPGPFNAPLGALIRLKHGIDFHAPDKKKARLIFLLLSPEKYPALHVRFLARICRLLKSKDLREELLTADNVTKAAQSIADAEADYPELTP